MAGSLWNRYVLALTVSCMRADATSGSTRLASSSLYACTISASRVRAARCMHGVA